jgi:hypothetical protein
MREPVVAVHGKVIARLRDTFFRVAVVDEGDTAICRLSGRMAFNGATGDDRGGLE